MTIADATSQPSATEAIAARDSVAASAPQPPEPPPAERALLLARLAVLRAGAAIPDLAQQALALYGPRSRSTAIEQRAAQALELLRIALSALLWPPDATLTGALARALGQELLPAERAAANAAQQEPEATPSGLARWKQARPKRARSGPRGEGPHEESAAREAL